MTRRAPALLLALTLAGCAGSPTVDGGLADDARGLWVQSRSVAVTDTLPELDIEPGVIRPRLTLWRSFRATDSTLTWEGVSRIAGGEPDIEAGGIRRASTARGRVLTFRIDTLTTEIRLAVRGDSLYATYPSGITVAYGRAGGTAPRSLVGVWEPVEPNPEGPGRLRVLPDGALRLEPDDAASPDQVPGLPDGLRVLGPVWVWDRVTYPKPPSIQSDYWRYNRITPYQLDGDRLTLFPEADPPIEFRRTSH